MPLVASQYARSGIYDIIKIEAEELPDGRVILNDKIVVSGFIGDPGCDGDVALFTGESEVYLLNGEHVDAPEAKVA